MQNFTNLELEKQQKIINAAFDEFTDKGYERASTNQIVKNAGIGKGMLFYYFNTKHELFLYLIDYAIEIIEREFLSKLPDETDLFERFKSIGTQKLAFLIDYPNAMNFMAKVLINDAEKLDETTRQKIQTMEKQAYSKRYLNLDVSLFRDDIDPEKAIRIIQWAFHGYEEEMTYRLKDIEIDVQNLDTHFEEFYIYLEVMKKAFYRKG